eukprot:COSAG02_NODE_4279_length_5553_cov_3.634763_1_plen_126_part_00
MSAGKQLTDAGNDGDRHCDEDMVQVPNSAPPVTSKGPSPRGRKGRRGSVHTACLRPLVDLGEGLGEDDNSDDDGAASPQARQAAVNAALALGAPTPSPRKTAYSYHQADVRPLPRASGCALSVGG